MSIYIFKTPECTISKVNYNVNYRLLNDNESKYHLVVAIWITGGLSTWGDRSIRQVYVLYSQVCYEFNIALKNKVLRIKK